MHKKISSYVLITLLAVLSAINYCVFVFPNKFTPAGIDGICTMIQDIFNINMGYFSLVINIPLLIIAFIMFNRDYAVKSLLYVLTFSVSVILIKESALSEIYYITETGSSTALAPVISGALRGVIYSYTLKLNGSAGGIDIIASAIKMKKPHRNFMDNIFIINTIIASCSFFVYDMNIEPVICSIIYAYISSYICNRLRSKEQENIKYEIITKMPVDIITYINQKLHQTATVIDAKGAFSEQNTSVVMCITKKCDAPLLEDFLLNYPNCITFKSYTTDSISGTTYK